MTKPELSTSPEDVDDSFFVDCVVSQTGQRYILVTQGDTKVFLRRSLFVGPMQKALSALAEGGIELVSLVDKIKRQNPLRMAEFGRSGSLQAGTKRQILSTRRPWMHKSTKAHQSHIRPYKDWILRQCLTTGVTYLRHPHNKWEATGILMRNSV